MPLSQIELDPASPVGTDAVMREAEGPVVSTIPVGNALESSHGAAVPSCVPLHEMGQTALVNHLPQSGEAWDDMALVANKPVILGLRLVRSLVAVQHP